MTLALPAPSIYDFTGIQQNFDYLSQQFPINQRNLTNLEGWHLVGATGEPGFQNGWVYFGSPFNTVGYYKDTFGRVFLRGLVKSGTVGATIFTLPTGYLPAGTELMATPSNGAFGQVQIAGTGAVQASIGSNVSFSLDNLSFRVA